MAGAVWECCAESTQCPGGRVYDGASDCDGVCCAGRCIGNQDCQDNDNDGYGLPPSPECESLEPDCNDQDPDIHPGADEDCFDGIDNDCDRLIDGEDTQACGSTEPDGGEDGGSSGDDDGAGSDAGEDADGGSEPDGGTGTDAGDESIAEDSKDDQPTDSQQVMNGSCGGCASSSLPGEPALLGILWIAALFRRSKKVSSGSSPRCR
jgi:hypothetical protein